MILNNIHIDSLLDIAINKIFTIYQNPRIRDYIDLYLVIQEKAFTIEYLVKKAKIKFDWNIDLIQLGKQFIKVKDKKDFPKLIKKIDNKTYEQFFLKHAKGFADEKIT